MIKMSWHELPLDNGKLGDKERGRARRVWSMYGVP